MDPSFVSHAPRRHREEAASTRHDMGFPSIISIAGTSAFRARLDADERSNAAEPQPKRDQRKQILFTAQLGEGENSCEFASHARRSAIASPLHDSACFPSGHLETCEIALPSRWHSPHCPGWIKSSFVTQSRVTGLKPPTTEKADDLGFSVQVHAEYTVFLLDGSDADHAVALALDR